MKYWHICYMNRLSELFNKKEFWQSLYTFQNASCTQDIMCFYSFKNDFLNSTFIYKQHRWLIMFLFCALWELPSLLFFNMLWFHLLCRRICSKSLIQTFSKAMHGRNILIIHYIQCWHYSVSVERQQSKIHYYNFLWVNMYIKLWLSLILHWIVI